jgi:hypothetical protein
MAIAKLSILALLLASVPGVTLAQASGCGWRGGALADPAATHRCLAERYDREKSPKSKAPDTHHDPTPVPSQPAKPSG